MDNENINIKKLAKELKISTSTISRAFNGSPDINKDTKEKILAFAREHNFLPNHYASNLRDKKSKTLAVIVPEIANDFFSQAINGIEEVARKKGFYILLYRTDDVFEKEVSFVNHIRLNKFELQREGTVNARLLKEPINLNYEVGYMQFEDYMIGYVKG